MFELKKGMLLVALTSSVILSATASSADSTKDAAKDSRGNFVTSTNGNCVRTRWQDQSDPCSPPAPAPVVVEKKQEQVVVSPAKSLQKEQRTVYFEFNKSDITPESKAKLDTLADVLKSDKNVKSAHIVGYADRFGSDQYNEKLSQKRANAVKDYLSSKGYINTSLAETRWLGKSSPITNCPTKADRKKQISCLSEDRRVEVEIDYYSN